MFVSLKYQELIFFGNFPFGNVCFLIINILIKSEMTYRACFLCYTTNLMMF